MHSVNEHEAKHAFKIVANRFQSPRPTGNTTFGLWLTSSCYSLKTSICGIPFVFQILRKLSAALLTQPHFSVSSQDTYYTSPSCPKARR